MHEDSSPHPVVTKATELRACNFVLPFLRGCKPELGKHTRNSILLDAEFGNEERMDHILRCHVQQHRLADRHMKVVDGIDVVRRAELPIAAGVEHIPLELAGTKLDGEDIGAGGDLLLDLRPERLADDTKEDQDQRRDDRPCDLQPVVSMRVDRLPPVAAAVADHEVDLRDEDSDEDSRCDPEDQIEHVVDRSGRRGCLVGKPPVGVACLYLRRLLGMGGHSCQEEGSDRTEPAHRVSKAHLSVPWI